MAATKTKKDALGNPIVADAIYECLESFGSTDVLGGCARGTRLRGAHAKVQRWPQFFLPDGASDDAEIFRARARLNGGA